jgi:hypothetical protein
MNAALARRIRQALPDASESGAALLISGQRRAMGSQPVNVVSLVVEK